MALHRVNIEHKDGNAHAVILLNDQSEVVGVEQLQIFGVSYLLESRLLGDIYSVVVGERQDGEWEPVHTYELPVIDKEAFSDTFLRMNGILAEAEGKREVPINA